jgi:hypothetical protein
MAIKILLIIEEQQIHYIQLFLILTDNIPLCFQTERKLNIFLCFRQTKQILFYFILFYFILFYFHNMFRPADDHQAISTKLKTRCNAV